MCKKEALEAAVVTGKLVGLRSYSTKAITERASPAEKVYDLSCPKATKTPRNIWSVNSYYFYTKNKCSQKSTQ